MTSSRINQLGPKVFTWTPLVAAAALAHVHVYGSGVVPGDPVRGEMFYTGFLALLAMALLVTLWRSRATTIATGFPTVSVLASILVFTYGSWGVAVHPCVHAPENTWECSAYTYTLASSTGVALLIVLAIWAARAAFLAFASGRGERSPLLDEPSRAPGPASER